MNSFFKMQEEDAHLKLINWMIKINYSGPIKKGVCYGLSDAIAKDALAKKPLDKLTHFFKLLADNTFDNLQNKIGKIRNKIKRREELLNDENYYSEIGSFCDGIAITQNPDIPEHRHLFTPGKQPKYQNLILTSHLTNPTQLEIYNLNLTCGIYNREGLIIFLDCLKQAGKDINVPISFHFSSGYHSIAIALYPSSWAFGDPNTLPIKYISITNDDRDTQQVAKMIIKSFCKENLDIVAFNSIFYINKLHQAIGEGFLSQLEQQFSWRIIHHPAITAKAKFRDANGHSGLFLAAANGYIDKVQSLLAHGFDPNIADNNNFTSLDVATQHGHIEIVKILLKGGANPKITLSNRTTALHIAAVEGYIDIVKMLLEYGANPNTVVLDNITAISAAADYGYADIVHLLLRYGANPNIANSDNITPLHRAAKNGHIEVVDVLLKHNSSQYLKFHFLSKSKAIPQATPTSVVPNKRRT